MGEIDDFIGSKKLNPETTITYDENDKKVSLRALLLEFTGVMGYIERKSDQEIPKMRLKVMICDITKGRRIEYPNHLPVPRIGELISYKQMKGRVVEVEHKTLTKWTELIIIIE